MPSIAFTMGCLCEVLQGIRCLRIGGGKVWLRIRMTRSARRRHSSAPLPQPLSDPSPVSPSSSSEPFRSSAFCSRKLATRYATHRGAYTSPPALFIFGVTSGQVMPVLTAMITARYRLSRMSVCLVPAERVCPAHCARVDPGCFSDATHLIFPVCFARDSTPAT